MMYVLRGSVGILMENIMPGIGKQLERYIFHTDLFHAVIDRPDALPCIANGILLSGNQKNGQTCIPSIIFKCASGPLHRAKQFPEKACGNVFPHQRVRQNTKDISVIFAVKKEQPIKGRPT